MLEHDVAGDDDPGDIFTARHLVHNREQNLFKDGAEPASPGATQDGLLGDRLERVLGELELDVIELEELAVLLDECVLWLGEDLLNVVGLQGVELR